MPELKKLLEIGVFLIPNLRIILLYTMWDPDILNKLPPEKLSKIPLEELYPAYGVHRFSFGGSRTVTALSAKNWGQLLQQMEEIVDEDEIVVTPELITSAGLSPSQVKYNQNLIEQRIANLVNFSRSFPGKIFILGTAFFDHNNLTNSTLVIQNGSIISILNKRSGASDEERNSFNLIANEPTYLLPNSNLGILICADFSSAALVAGTSDAKSRDRLYQIIQRTNLIGQDVNFIDPQAETLLVIACWGIGGSKEFMDRYADANKYYRTSLNNSAMNVLLHYPNLKEIIVVDRAPTGFYPNDPESNYVSTIPLNTIFKRRKI